MERLTTAIDQSSYIHTVSFTDEVGNPIIPVTIKWSLFDSAGAIVNARQNIPVIPAAAITLVLHGDDLIAAQDKVRYLLTEITYVSALTGETLPIKKMVKFKIEDYPYV